ncbi:MAG: hypothetical protein EG823_05710 [Actinobacteria bacterium]|nr:hypothetical protein [Actinomycetota bacterium]
MSRDPSLDPAIALAIFGGQDASDIAGAAALSLVMQTLEPWHPPTGRALAQARKTAAKHKLSEDLAAFVPKKRAGASVLRSYRDAYHGVIIALKRLDALEGDERAQAIEDLRALLGAGLV